MTCRAAYLAMLLALTVVLGTWPVRAQVTTRSVRGLVDQCHSVEVLDKFLPVDSLAIRPPLSDSVRSAVMIAMVGSCKIISDTQSAVPLGDLGRWFEVELLGVSDSVTIISPLALDTAYRTTTYQMVVPIEADTVVVDSVVTTRQWNGSSGGVVMIRADSAIAFKGIIDVSGLGFAGGLRSANAGDCGLIIPCDRAGSGLSGGKGSSPLRPDSLCRSGHRPWASGGGGGDAHNSGGGGGGNASRGGRGGDEYHCGTVNGMWGMPGTGIINESADRVFLGGGGGGGHQNNSVATDGAPGGGIVMLRARKLIGDTVRLQSIGASAIASTRNDGGGGGGAGGTVLVDACSSVSPISINASGGRGSNVDHLHGPGGGGAGGFVLLQPALMQLGPGSLRVDLSGGQSGTSNGLPLYTNGASGGQRGRILARCPFVVPHSVQIDSISLVGDTMTIDLVTNDSTSSCKCIVEHTITVEGQGASALTLGTQLFMDVLLTTRVTWPVITFTALVPSQRSFRIPVLTVLSEDTTINVRSTSGLYGVTADQQCLWNGAEHAVRLNVCGFPARQVMIGIPIRIQVTVSPLREITCEIETGIAAEASVRIYDAIGSLIEVHPDVIMGPPPARSVESVRFNASGWPVGIYFIVVRTSQGTRSIMIRL